MYIELLAVLEVYIFYSPLPVVHYSSLHATGRPTLLHLWQECCPSHRWHALRHDTDLHERRTLDTETELRPLSWRLLSTCSVLRDVGNGFVYRVRSSHSHVSIIYVYLTL
jgi:hypothetical protein